MSVDIVVEVNSLDSASAISGSFQFGPDSLRTAFVGKADLFFGIFNKPNFAGLRASEKFSLFAQAAKNAEDAADKAEAEAAKAAKASEAK